jgi:hypothetical protein
LKTHLGLAVFVVSALVAGCRGADANDQPSTPIADPLGGGTRLPQIIGPATWEDPNNSTSAAGCKYPPAQNNVSVNGLTIVAVDLFDETADGSGLGDIYVDDTTAGDKPYSAVTVFKPSFSPPDLRLEANDVVDFLGTYSELPGPPSAAAFPYCRTLPEFTGTLSFRFDGRAPLQPLTLTIDKISTYAGARQWIGKLVTVENITISAAPKVSKGRYSAPILVGGIQSVDDPVIANELYDIVNEGPTLGQGTVVKSVTGVLTYFYGFHIAPRSPADITLGP